MTSLLDMFDGARMVPYFVNDLDSFVVEYRSEGLKWPNDQPIRHFVITGYDPIKKMAECRSCDGEVFVMGERQLELLPSTPLCIFEKIDESRY